MDKQQVALPVDTDDLPHQAPQMLIAAHFGLAGPSPPSLLNASS